jgi:quinol monooxygenase YgiN
MLKQEIPMSVNVILEVQSKPECIEELKTTFKNILPDTRSYDGCIGVQVVGNQDDALNLILLETWETRQQYEKYLGWRDETGALEALGAMLSQPPSIRYYDNLDI